jgi:hypothetical protein
MAEAENHAYRAERIHILGMIERGEITPGEGVSLLEALIGEKERPKSAASTAVSDSANKPPPPQAKIPPSADSHKQETSEGTQADPDLDPTTPQGGATFKKWSWWWMIPFWAAVALTVGSAVLIYTTFQSRGFAGFWFYFAWLPFTLGVVLMALAWTSRNARWIHIRIQQAPGESPERIALSFPLPIRPTAWLLRLFGRWIPGLNESGLDELILALERHPGDQAPLFVEIDEGETGERVQVLIG